MRSMWVWLASMGVASFCLRLLLFFSWKWFLPAWRTITLPLPVTL